MSLLFPDELADPWSDNSGGIPVLSSSLVLSPELKADEQDVTGEDYLLELVEQNEELLHIVEKMKQVELPSVYNELYNKHIRSDGLVDFLSMETVFERAGLNQISIENIMNLMTMGQKLEFTTLNRSLWNAFLALVALEQQHLGNGNFQSLEANLSHLPPVVLVEKQTPTVWSPTEPKKKVINMSDSLRKLFNPNAKDVISIAEIPEKEGLVFKHINYLVAHSMSLNESDPPNGRKVVRRYSDFLWLYEVLLKKYPFRMVPGLPPKRFSGSSADPLFLERRKRGLSRFINLVMKHPVLSKEPMVVVFLTIPTELASWRKQANVEIVEEFEGQRISKRYIDHWNDNIEQVWKDAELSLAGIQNNWAKITLLVERFERRKQLYNADNQKFVQVLTDFIKDTNKIYPIDPSDIPTINVGIQSVATHVKTAVSLLKDESQLVEDGILKDFKEFNEYLTSLYGLFERRNKLGGNAIQETKQKVELNQAKLSQLKKKSDIKGSEIDSLVQTINNDKQHIIKQSNRDWLIKECVQQEFSLFQETQYKITKIFQDWVADRLKYSELHSENWVQLVDAIQEMPSNLV